jgi:hypothetical protein
MTKRSLLSAAFLALLPLSACASPVPVTSTPPTVLSTEFLVRTPGGGVGRIERFVSPDGYICYLEIGTQEAPIWCNGK